MCSIIWQRVEGTILVAYIGQHHMDSIYAMYGQHMEKEAKQGAARWNLAVEKKGGTARGGMQYVRCGGQFQISLALPPEIASGGGGKCSLQTMLVGTCGKYAADCPCCTGATTLWHCTCRRHRWPCECTPLFAQYGGSAKALCSCSVCLVDISSGLK